MANETNPFCLFCLSFSFVCAEMKHFNLGLLEIPPLAGDEVISMSLSSPAFGGICNFRQIKKQKLCPKFLCKVKAEDLKEGEDQRIKMLKIMEMS